MNITINPTSAKVLSHTEYTGTSHKDISVTTSYSTGASNRGKHSAHSEAVS